MASTVEPLTKRAKAGALLYGRAFMVTIEDREHWECSAHTLAATAWSEKDDLQVAKSLFASACESFVDDGDGVVGGVQSHDEVSVSALVSMRDLDFAANLLLESTIEDISLLEGKAYTDAKLVPEDEDKRFYFKSPPSYKRGCARVFVYQNQLHAVEGPDDKLDDVFNDWCSKAGIANTRDVKVLYPRLEATEYALNRYLPKPLLDALGPLQYHAYQI